METDIYEYRDAIPSESAERQRSAEDPANERSEGNDLLKGGAALIAWLLFLVIGGGVLAQYYATIHYIPEIDWHVLLTYIAVATLIGGGLTCILSLAVFLPGYIWNQFLIRNRCLRDVFCDRLTCDVVRDNLNEASHVRIWQVAKLLGVAYCFDLIIAHIIPLKPQFWCYLLVILTIAIGFLTIRLWLLESARKGSRDAPPSHLLDETYPPGKTDPLDGTRTKEVASADKVAPTFRPTYVFWFSLSMLFGQTAVVVIRAITSQPWSWDYISMSLLCTGAVLFSNHAVASVYHLSKRQAI
ncbi:MAG: hypothetical protein ACREAC_31565, partial [Blastocatellia bacterium]